MNDEQLLRYSRHILLDEIGIEGQAKIIGTHALVIGLGSGVLGVVADERMDFIFDPPDLRQAGIDNLPRAGFAGGERDNALSATFTLNTTERQLFEAKANLASQPRTGIRICSAARRRSCNHGRQAKTRRIQRESPSNVRVCSPARVARGNHGQNVENCPSFRRTNPGGMG